MAATEHRKLIEGAGAFYSPSGHLIFRSAGGLLAVRFDLDALETFGTPFPAVENVAGPS